MIGIYAALFIILKLFGVGIAANISWWWLPGGIAAIFVLRLLITIGLGIVLALINRR